MINPVQKKRKVCYESSDKTVYLRNSHLNHHLKSEDSSEDIIQILEDLRHRITVEINPVTDAD